ncbi:hypothetical protein QLF86_25425, partial [Salmonella enterica subsp. enterica serovar Oslo]
MCTSRLATPFPPCSVIERSAAQSVVELGAEHARLSKSPTGVCHHTCVVLADALTPTPVSYTHLRA